LVAFYFHFGQALEGEPPMGGSKIFATLYA